MPANQTPPTQADVEALRAAVSEATDRAFTAAEESVKLAVQYVAALTRLQYPDAQRVGLISSEEGDWLIPASIDGDQAKAETLEDDLMWATSCMYDANRSASPALHSATSFPLASANTLYIDIAQALDGR